MQGLIFPYDLIKLICFKYTDPKTCYNMMLTCRRLYYEKYKFYFERRWLMIGLFPLIYVYESFRYRVFDECDLYVNKIRCEECGWIINRDVGIKYHTCPFELIKCYNDICGKHRRVLYQNCEYCDLFIDLFICPNDSPRCRKHQIYECFGCCEIIDPGKCKEKHICKSVKECIEAKLHTRLIEYSNNSYIASIGEQTFLFVKNKKDIPPLRSFKKICVFLFDYPFKSLIDFKENSIGVYLEYDEFCYKCFRTDKKLFPKSVDVFFCKNCYI